MAGNYAANMRMFETTGVSSLLLTDKKKNLNEYFDVGNEVFDYEDFEDAARKVKFLLQNPAIIKKNNPNWLLKRITQR
jgi:spore maturation protein CgeB